ncbi:hypothetical protein WN943_011437 [Citrus x changshan-huyou]
MLKLISTKTCSNISSTKTTNSTITNWKTSRIRSRDHATTKILTSSSILTIRAINKSIFPWKTSHIRGICIICIHHTIIGIKHSMWILILF